MENIYSNQIHIMYYFDLNYIYHKKWCWASTLCKHMVSGSISLPSPGFFSPFPHGTCSLSTLKVFSLRPWSAYLPTKFHVFRGTQENSSGEFCSFTGLSPSMAALSRDFQRTIINPVIESTIDHTAHKSVRHYKISYIFHTCVRIIYTK